MAALDYLLLQERYGGQFVAHRDGEVIASAETYDELMDRLEHMAVDWTRIVIEYIESADSVHVY